MGFRALNLSRAFGGRTIFHAPELTAESQGLVFLVGPNGSGKTTFFRVISTLILPTTGDAWLNGVSICRDPQKVKKEFAFVPATQGGFWGRLNGLENLEIYASFLKISSRGFQEKLLHLKKTMNIESPLRTKARFWSTGMNQMMALARVLIGDPRILILDEPTRSLDPQNSLEILNSLKLLSKDKLILLSSHHAENWKRADRIWELHDGVLTDKGAPL